MLQKFTGCNRAWRKSPRSGDVQGSLPCRLWRRSGSGRRTASGAGSAAAGSGKPRAAGVLWRRPAGKRLAEPGVLQRRAVPGVLRRRVGGGNDGEDGGCGCRRAPARRAASLPRHRRAVRRGGLPRIPGLGVKGFLQFPYAPWRAECDFPGIRGRWCLGEDGKRTAGGDCWGCERSSWGTVPSFANAVLAGILRTSCLLA
jgi:hypothetical protein